MSNKHSKKDSKRFKLSQFKGLFKPGSTTSQDSPSSAFPTDGQDSSGSQEMGTPNTVSTTHEFARTSATPDESELVGATSRRSSGLLDAKWFSKLRSKSHDRRSAASSHQNSPTPQRPGTPVADAHDHASRDAPADPDGGGAAGTSTGNVMQAQMTAHQDAPPKPPTNVGGGADAEVSAPNVMEGPMVVSQDASHKAPTNLRGGADAEVSAPKVMEISMVARQDVSPPAGIEGDANAEVSASKDMETPTVVPQDASHNAPANPKGDTSAKTSTLKDNVKAALNFTQTLMKKLPEIVDGNPVKMGLSLAKVIIEIKDAVKENRDDVKQDIARTDGLLDIMKNTDLNNEWGKEFLGVLEVELKELVRLSQESWFTRIADHEEKKGQIKNIFQRVEDAEHRFLLCHGIAMFKTVVAMDAKLQRSLEEQLKVSHMADHKYNYTGEDKKIVRDVCASNMRIRILDNITNWANDTSPNSEQLYWLFGPAGSGKSTIAHTIAHHFDAHCIKPTGGSKDMIVLCGNFFCNRQFPETSNISYIICTIVYHIALHDKPFADALNNLGDFEIIHHKTGDQLMKLLSKPWQASRSELIPWHYLVIIDALDEMG